MLLFSSCILAFLAFILTTEKRVQLVPKRCNEDPMEICKLNGMAGVMASARNLPFLMELLRTNKIDAAAVCGWNDTPGNFVLRANGALAPYDPLTNNASYAFCYGKVYYGYGNKIPAPSTYVSYYQKNKESLGDYGRYQAYEKSWTPFYKENKQFPGAYTEPSIPFYPQYNNESCIPICPPYKNQEPCIPICPPYKNQEPCIPICPPYKNQELCIPICPPYKNQEPCIPICPPYKNQDPCIPICPPYKNQEPCIPICPPYNKEPCIPICPPYKNQEPCIPICPPYNKEPCIPICPPYKNQEPCIPICPPYNKEPCIPICPPYNQEACIPICPPYQPYEPCIPICPPYNKEPCIPICPPYNKEPCIPICPPYQPYEPCIPICPPYPYPPYPFPPFTPDNIPNIPCPWEKPYSYRYKAKCKKFPQREKMIGYNPVQPTKGDAVSFTQECISTEKTFIIDEEDLGTDQRVKVTEVTDVESERTRLLLLAAFQSGGPKLDVPFILRFPNTLLALKNYLQTTMKVQNPCLYTNKNGDVFVILNNVLNRVDFSKKPGTVTAARLLSVKRVPYKLPSFAADPPPPPPPKPTPIVPITYEFTPITGQALTSLIQMGLYNITFKSTITQM